MGWSLLLRCVLMFGGRAFTSAKHLGKQNWVLQLKSPSITVIHKKMEQQNTRCNSIEYQRVLLSEKPSPRQTWFKISTYKCNQSHLPLFLKADSLLFFPPFLLSLWLKFSPFFSLCFLSLKHKQQKRPLNNQRNTRQALISLSIHHLPSYWKD